MWLTLLMWWKGQRFNLMVTSSNTDHQWECKIGGRFATNNWSLFWWSFVVGKIYAQITTLNLQSCYPQPSRPPLWPPLCRKWPFVRREPCSSFDSCARADNKKARFCIQKRRRGRLFWGEKKDPFSSRKFLKSNPKFPKCHSKALQKSKKFPRRCQKDSKNLSVKVKKVKTIGECRKKVFTNVKNMVVKFDLTTKSQIKSEAVVRCKPTKVIQVLPNTKKVGKRTPPRWSK